MMWLMHLAVVVLLLSEALVTGVCIPNGVALLRGNSVFFGWVLISNNTANGMDTSIVMTSGTFINQVQLAITEPGKLPVKNTYSPNVANMTRYYYQYTPSFRMNCSKPSNVYSLQVAAQVNYRTSKGVTGTVSTTWSPQFACSICTPANPCNSTPCGASKRCIVSNGIPECQCPNGMRYDANYDCVTDPCASNPCASSARCVSAGPNFICQCPVGYSYNSAMGCIAPSNATECQKSRAETSFWQRPYVPQCMTDGRYSPSQCDTTLGHCWCVDRAGKEISGTQVPLGSSNLTCYAGPCAGLSCFEKGYCAEEGDRCVCSVVYPAIYALPAKTPPICTYTTCELDRGLAMVATQEFEAYWPTCDANGLYTPQQCDMTYYAPSCWCVDGNGHELPGTMVNLEKGTDTPPDLGCADLRGMTDCQLAQYLASQSPVSAPQCDTSGNYVPQQCYRPTRECWCVDPGGLELPGSRIVSPPSSTWPPALRCYGGPCFGRTCQANGTCEAQGGICACNNGGQLPDCKPCATYSCSAAGTCAACPSGNECRCLNQGNLPHCVPCASKSVGLVRSTGVRMANMSIGIIGRELQLQYSTPAGHIMSEAAGYAGLTPCPLNTARQPQPSLLPIYATNPGITVTFNIPLDRLTQSDCQAGSTVDIFVCAYAKVQVIATKQYVDAWAWDPSATPDQNSQDPSFKYTWKCGCEAKRVSSSSLDAPDATQDIDTDNGQPISPVIWIGIAVGVCTVVILSAGLLYLVHRHRRTAPSPEDTFSYMEPVVALSVAPVAHGHHAMATPADVMFSTPGPDIEDGVLSPKLRPLPSVAEQSRCATPLAQENLLTVLPRHM